MWRRLALAFALALSLSTLGAAVSYSDPVAEGLVEGHTVYAILEVTASATTAHQEFAAAVAVLIQETQVVRSASRFAGVLWFNDQYLASPSASARADATRRIPCTGAVLAVNAGDPDPRGFGLEAYDTPNYVESYFITDPNDHTWNVDKWNISGTLVWTVALRDIQAGYSIPDDGECRGGAYSERPCGDELVDTNLCRPVSGAYRFLPDDAPGSYARDPGANGHAYRSRQYNALLYFYLEDLQRPATPKNHTEGSADWKADGTGCQPPVPGSDRAFPCPGNDDDREGNSHPYNPSGSWMNRRWAGQGNHGGSDDCKGASDDDCHATRLIEIYYG
ncbi:MAG: hypothetical protein ACLGHP_10575, partial [Vicinamibacteria bacterium]